MRKKIVIGALFPLVASLGLWLASGSASATHATHAAPVDRQATVHTLSAKASTASENQSGTESEKQGGTESEKQGGESEGAADAAAQHADCLKVGIDDSVTPNVQYDDQTGACSLDTGSDNGGN